MNEAKEIDAFMKWVKGPEDSIMPLTAWLARARKAAEDAEKWLPIESAPKDEWVWCAHYDKSLKVWFQYEAITSNDAGDSWEDNYGQSQEPTHWRPLPPPPAAQEGDGA